MTTVKNHYENHLAKFYAWMCGDFKMRCDEFKQLLITNNITPKTNGIAVDLGAGHGIQSIPLAQIGFKVHAVDFNAALLHELKQHAQHLPIEIFQQDIQDSNLFSINPELIVCCGDTLTHLDNKDAIRNLIQLAVEALPEHGKIVLSFRDYTQALEGDNRFIHVKSDTDKILTCILNYSSTHVEVTDLFHERINGTWLQKVSSYQKVRISPVEIIDILESAGMSIELNTTINRLNTIIAMKSPTTLFSA